MGSFALSKADKLSFQCFVFRVAPKLSGRNSACSFVHQSHLSLWNRSVSRPPTERRRSAFPAVAMPHLSCTRYTPNDPPCSSEAIEDGSLALLGHLPDLRLLSSLQLQLLDQACCPSGLIIGIVCPVFAAEHALDAADSEHRPAKVLDVRGPVAGIVHGVQNL